MESPITTTAKLQAEQTARAAQCVQQAARMAMHPPEPGALTEAVELASATARRMAELHTRQLKAWADWSTFAQSIEGADTVPKFADRTGNIGLQAQSLVVQQVGQWSELMDNVVVNYAFWLNRHADGAKD